MSGWKNGPVHIASSASYQDVAALKVPAGRWIVWAKLFITTDGWGGILTARCKLDSSGGPSHHAAVDVTNLPLDGIDRQSMALSTWASFRAGGKVTLSCGGTVAARWIKIMAMKVGTLTTTDMATGFKTTVGSSQPNVVAGWKNPSTKIVEGTTETVASLALGGGSWAVRATFTVLQSHGFPGSICRLTIGGVVRDTTRFPWGQGKMVVDLQTATSLARGQSVKVTCEVEDMSTGHGGGAYELGASEIRITAVKLGTLVTFDADDDPVAHGSGLPKAYYESAPKQKLSTSLWSTVAHVDLEPGRWMAFSRAQLGYPAPLSDWYFNGHLQCQLIAGSDYDQSHVEDGLTPSLPLAVVHRFADDGRIRLSCSADDAKANDPAEITAIRITVFKLGSLSNVAL